LSTLRCTLLGFILIDLLIYRDRFVKGIFSKKNKTNDDDEALLEMAGDDPNATAGEGGGTSSWAKLQISPDDIGSMPYGNKRIKIYEHAANQRNYVAPLSKNMSSKYYYAPITLLDHKSARSSFNNVTKRAEMEFRIEMWNDDVEQKIIDWIKRELDSAVKESFVQVIPFE
jgi:hypothetical protein